MKRRIGLPTPSALVLLGTALSVTTCGRTSLPDDVCHLVVLPSSLDFGTVPVGGAATRSLTLENDGAEVCLISGVALRQDTDAGFSLPAGTPSSLSVWPRVNVTISVAFAPGSASLPLSRSGALEFHSNDASQLQVDVPLTAQIESHCVLAISPAAIDFGHVPLGSSTTRSVTVANAGTGPCEVGNLAIGSGSDPEFAVAVAQPPGFTLASGEARPIAVTFTATDASPPHHRTGTLTFQSTDPARARAAVPLSADIDIGCDLTITPSSLSFGNVILNTTVNAAVTLGNDGSSVCLVTGIALGTGTDPEFVLPAGHATSLVVAPGASQTIPVRFTASDSAPPHLKTGTLVFRTGNPRAPNATVPLSAYINSACVEASQWIYTVDQGGRFSRFDPATLSFTDIGVLACPDSSGPNSMAVDQNAVAWVAYTDGQLFRVDTTTAQCQATKFQPNQSGLLEFGMGFVFQPMTGTDTLYIAGGQNAGMPQSTLATISFPSLTVTPIGTVTAGFPELTGTGDGALWGFIPGSSSSTHVATLLRIDTSSGATLESHAYPALTSSGNWAMKFWGGSFWIFLGQSIYKVQRATPDILTTAIANTGRSIVGAGVSTCAPIH